jgi:signal transduction histidine kinase
VLAVRDQGPGIAPEDLETVFERFARLPSLNERGLGLGLYICRQIIEAHGGTIRAESQLGQGTTFVVELPAGAP